MILTAPELTALKSSLSCWEYLEDLGAGIVFLGVGGEYVAEFTAFARKRGIERRLGKLSTLVLMVGLVVELLGVVKTSQLSGQIIASLEGQTGQARVEIAKANERVANAEKRTAELLAEIQPRSLTVIQQRNVGNALRHFSGRKVLVSSFRGDLEAYQVGKQIVASLKYAGLDILENLGNAGGLPSTGVLIACSRSNREIASVLSAALQSTGALGNVPIFESHGTIGGGAELGAFKGSRDPLEIPQFEVLVASKPLPILK